MYNNSETLFTLRELCLEDEHDIFILPHHPPEPTQKEHKLIQENSAIETESSEIKLQQRPDWIFHDDDTQYKWQERNRKKWQKYAGKLVIIENIDSIAPTSIFAIDKFGYASIVSIAPALVESFNNNLKELKKGKTSKVNSDGSLTIKLNKLDFIYYISCYTGFHIEFDTRFAKGMSISAIVRMLSNSIKTTIHDISELPPSPHSVADRKSPNTSPTTRTHYSHFRDANTGIKCNDVYHSLNLSNNPW